MCDLAHKLPCCWFSFMEYRSELIWYTTWNVPNELKYLWLYQWNESKENRKWSFVMNVLVNLHSKDSVSDAEYKLKEEPLFVSLNRNNFQVSNLFSTENNFILAKTGDYACRTKLRTDCYQQTEKLDNDVITWYIHLNGWNSNWNMQAWQNKAGNIYYTSADDTLRTHCCLHTLLDP